MRRVVEKLLRRCGSSMLLLRETETVALIGLLRHSGSQSQQSMEKDFSPLGEIPGGVFSLIVPMEPVLGEGDILELEGRRYRIEKLETERLRGKGIFQWGLCTEAGGEDTWGSQL